MASMAARTNSIATLRLPGDVLMAEKNETATKLGFYSSRHVAMITRKNGNFSVRAGAGGTPRSVETINGKINGVHVGEATLFGNKNSIELINGDGDSPPQSSLHGKFVEERFVYRQTLVIRSYEIGPDKTATMETLMNLLQETALNHVTSSGLAGNGFGATREMSIRKLIWVVTRIHIQVQRYNSWGDVVEIDTWVDAAGKNGMRRDWIIRDYQTQEIITRATSTWVIMNRETRRLSKIPDQVRQEVLPFYLNRFAIAKEKNDSEKIDKLTDDTAERITSGLASVPINVLGDYDLTSMTLEYIRECRQSNLLESLTSTTSSLADDSNCKNNSINRRPDLEYTHLLRMQADKAEIVRARTEWNTKQKDKLH